MKTRRELSYEDMEERRWEREQSEKRRVLRGLDTAAGLVAVGAMALACCGPFRLLPAVVMVPGILIVLLLAVVTLAKGGIMSGLMGLVFALIIMPGWMFFIPSLIEGSKQAGSLEKYKVQLDRELREMNERPARRPRTD